MRKLFTTIGVAVLALGVVTAQAADTYQIDPVHSHFGFKIRHLLSKTAGEFNEFGGTIVIDPADMTKSTVDLTIKAASIDTDNENRDKHLKSADFFDVETYPEVTFKSTGIEMKEENLYHVTGDFSMRGVTKSITIPVEILGMGPGMGGGKTAGFEAEFELNRKDYGINWNKALDVGGFVLGDDVEIGITIEAHSKGE